MAKKAINPWLDFYATPNRRVIINPYRFPSGGGGDIANFDVDLSGASPANGWDGGYYGVGFPTDPSTYLNTGMSFTAATGWSGPFSFSTPFIQRGFMHPPFGAGDDTTAVARWTSDYTGNVRITASGLQLQNGAGSTRFCVYRNTSGLITPIILTTSVEPDVVIDTPVNSGDTIDFVIDSVGGAGADGTNLTNFVIIPN